MCGNNGATMAWPSASSPQPVSPLNPLCAAASFRPKTKRAPGPFLHAGPAIRPSPTMPVYAFFNQEEIGSCSPLFYTLLGGTRVACIELAAHGQATNQRRNGGYRRRPPPRLRDGRQRLHRLVARPPPPRPRLHRPRHRQEPPYMLPLCSPRQMKWSEIVCVLDGF